MSGMDSDYRLVIAAAQAAGPCPPGTEDAWGRRVASLAVELHLLAGRVSQDIARIQAADHRFVARVEKVEIEETSRRGLITLLPPSGTSEHVRTERDDTERGAVMIARARSLIGHMVLVYRYNDRIEGGRREVRMVAYLEDLDGGTVAVATAKNMVLTAAGGDTARAQQAWAAAGLPADGTVSISALDKAFTAARQDTPPPCG